MKVVRCSFFSAYGKCKFGNSCAYLHLNKIVTIDPIMKEHMMSLQAEVEQLKRENKEMIEKFQILAAEFMTLKNEISKRKPFIEEDAETGNVKKGRKKTFDCDQCEHVANTKASLNKHIGSKHKSASQSQNILKEPTACRQNCEGCPNFVELYSDPLSALCPTCKLNIKSSLSEYPPPPNTCICCQENTCLPQIGFCSNCYSIQKKTITWILVMACGCMTLVARKLFALTTAGPTHYSQLIL